MLILSVSRNNTFMLFTISFVLSMALGCGSKSEGYSDSVSGTVMLKGQPVSGEVVFQWANKKENVSLISSDGRYNIINPEKGQASILVRKIAGSEPSAKPQPGIVELPGTTKNTGGVLTPIKYAKNTDELTFKVEGGKQTYNIDLK
jgi:hypothetical protein